MATKDYLPIRVIETEVSEVGTVFHVADQSSFLTRGAFSNLESDSRENEKILSAETELSIEDCINDFNSEKDSLVRICSKGSALITDAQMVEAEILSLFNSAALRRMFQYELKGRMVSKDQVRDEVRSAQKGNRAPIHIPQKKQRDGSGKIIRKKRLPGSRPWDPPVQSDSDMEKKDLSLQNFHKSLLREWVGKDIESRFLTYFEPEAGSLFTQMFGFVKDKSGYYFVLSTRDTVVAENGNHLVTAVYSVTGQRMELRNIFLNSVEIKDLEIENNYYSYDIEGRFCFDYPAVIDTKRLSSYLDRKRESGMLFYFGKPKSANDGLKQKNLFKQ